MTSILKEKRGILEPVFSRGLDLDPGQIHPDPQSRVYIGTSSGFYSVGGSGQAMMAAALGNDWYITENPKSLVQKKLYCYIKNPWFWTYFFMCV